jgi:sulfite exporter TauE/SafE
VLALGGVRSLAIALPPLLVAGRSAVAAGFYVLAFGLGVAAAMVAFGVLLTEGTRRLGVRRVWVTGASGAISVMLGVWWVASNL